MALSTGLGSPTQSPTPQQATVSACYYDPTHPSCENVHLGYWWLDRFWVPGYINNLSWYTRAPQHIIGRAAYYAPWLMHATAEYRGLDLDGYLDGVSLMSPADIGQTVWIKRPGHGWEGPYLIVDCARRGDMYGVIVHNQEVVEVGFRTAERWGMATMTSDGFRAHEWMIEGVEVFKGPRPPDEPGEPVVYRDWFLESVQFATRWERPPGLWGRELFEQQPQAFIGRWLAI